MKETRIKDDKTEELYQQLTDTNFYVNRWKRYGYVVTNLVFLIMTIISFLQEKR